MAPPAPAHASIASSPIGGHEPSGGPQSAQADRPTARGYADYADGGVRNPRIWLIVAVIAAEAILIRY